MVRVQSPESSEFFKEGALSFWAVLLFLVKCPMAPEAMAPLESKSCFLETFMFVSLLPGSL
jgi:hypothetical protein